ncbi:hypothetical protein Bca52824_025432 [Brassica carinata]|uniref:Pre-mRNA-processing factor 39 n=1 Tax=Brassica carinata TaxID=52824 RepID=A0A8X7V7W0_BRACI|nr:hypothetical protein Bca52824_025432 [Brassica carinata]
MVDSSLTINNVSLVKGTCPEGDSSGSTLTRSEVLLRNTVKDNPSAFYAWIALIEETERIAQDCIAKIRKGKRTRPCAFIKEHYCAHVINTSNAYIAFIRGLFERALAFVGTDYLSSPLWDKYLEYESKECGRLAMIYTRIFENPIQGLDRYFDSFKGLAQALPLSELRSAVAAAATSDAEGISEADPEELIMKKYIGIVEAKYIKAKEFESKIIGFETAIGRRNRNFHVQPLSVEERENWHNFLDFIESDGELPKVYHLYERCVVTCADYPEYWIRASFKLLYSEISPGHVEAVMRHANMEHRKGDLDGAFSVYDDVISVEKSKKDSILLPLLYAQYSKFSYLLIHELLFLESILPRPRNIDQFKALIENFRNPNAADIQNSCASSDEREDLSLIYIGFLHRFGDFASSINAQRQHTKIFLDPRISSELKKYEVLASDRMKREKTNNDVAQLQTSSQAPAQPHQWNTAYGQHQAYLPHAYVPLASAAYPTHASQPHAGYYPSQTPTILYSSCSAMSSTTGTLWVYSSTATSTNNCLYSGSLWLYSSRRTYFSCIPTPTGLCTSGCAGPGTRYCFSILQQ